jgi:hypothetical protein
VAVELAEVNVKERRVQKGRKSLRQVHWKTTTPPYPVFHILAFQDDQKL